MRCIAIIPARGGSKRLPRKNILPLCGEPMLKYPIATAQESKIFDDIIVSTEDSEIKEIAEKTGVSVMTRSSELATDESTVDQVCLDILKQLQTQNKLPDFFCAIYPTAIFIEAHDLIESAKIITQTQEHDVIMGVSGYPIHPYKALQNENGTLKPVFPKQNDQKSQTYPHWVASNGTFYWARNSHFLKNPTFFPDRLTGHEISFDKGIDIDTPEDYEQACTIMAAKQKGGKQC